MCSLNKMATVQSISHQSRMTYVETDELRWGCGHFLLHREGTMVKREHSILWQQRMTGRWWLLLCRCQGEGHCGLILGWCPAAGLRNQLVLSACWDRQQMGGEHTNIVQHIVTRWICRHIRWPHHVTTTTLGWYTVAASSPPTCGAGEVRVDHFVRVRV